MSVDTFVSRQDVLPMISKIEFDATFKPAMQLAFGKALICRNQDICSQFSKSHDLDAVTLEGNDVTLEGNDVTLEGNDVALEGNGVTLKGEVHSGPIQIFNRELFAKIGNG